MKKELTLIKVDDIVENPMNRMLFRELRPTELGRLEFSIQTVGVFTPCVAYAIEGDKFMLISGHNRRRYVLEHGDKNYGRQLWCEIVERPRTQTEEMYLMVACNLGRGLSDTWVIKMFSYLLQIVSQLRKSDEKEKNTPFTEDDALESEEIYAHTKYGQLIKEQLSLFGVHGKSAREVLSKALQVSGRQYDCLIMLCSADYRVKLYNRIMKVAKLKKNATEEWDAEFDKIITAVESKDLSLNAACDMVKNFVTQIEALEKKKAPKPERPAKPVPPKKKEKDVEFEVEDATAEVPVLSFNVLKPDTVFEKYCVRLDNDTPMMIVDGVLLALDEDLKTVFSVTEYELTTYLNELRAMK